MKQTQPHLLLAACLTACAGSSLTDTTTTSTDSSLTSAQCTFQGFNAAVQSCFDTFKTCLASSEEATAADCQAALKACLPPPPERPQTGGSGGPQGGPVDGCGPGMMGPPLDGGEPPRPPQGGDGQGGPGMGPPPPPLPDPAALQACHDAATACVAGGTDPATCSQTEHDCVRAAFQAAFQAACAASGNTSEKCAEGVDGMPPAADGGSQCGG